ncbi:teneurin-a-like [Daphnia carinata]|uniref:teneurin-a-like n=1 Tax=Daphnia carinata TaxID=120202 RepID=UPI00257E6740|nr:teneurin-a-like [Daphnia carinata]
MADLIGRRHQPTTATLASSTVHCELQWRSEEEDSEEHTEDSASSSSDEREPLHIEAAQQQPSYLNAEPFNNHVVAPNHPGYIEPGYQHQPRHLNQLDMSEDDFEAMYNNCGEELYESDPHQGHQHRQQHGNTGQRNNGQHRRSTKAQHIGSSPRGAALGSRSGRGQPHQQQQHHHHHHHQQAAAPTAGLASQQQPQDLMMNSPQHQHQRSGRGGRLPVGSKSPSASSQSEPSYPDNGMEPYSTLSDHGTPPPAPAPGNGMGAPPPPPDFPPRGSSFNHPSLVALQSQPLQQQRAATLVVTKDNSDEPPTYEVIPYSTGKAPSNSGWNFLPADNNRQHGSHTLGHNTLNRGHHNGPNTVSSSMMNAPNNHHVLTPVPGDPSGRLVMTLLPSQGHDLMHGTQHEPHHHSGASHTSSSHSTRYNHPGHGTSTSRQTLTSSLQSSWLMRRGNGDARSSSSGADMNHHHHLGLGVIGGGRGVGGGPGKGCATPQCSWRLLAIALLLTCGLLAAALAYFTVSSIGASTVSDPNCILIEDAQVTLPREEKNNNSKMPVKESAPPRTASSSVASNGDPGGSPGDGGTGRPSRQEQPISLNETPSSNGPSLPDLSGPVSISSSTNGALELEADGRFKLLTIEPAQLWVAYVQIGGSQSALRIEVQLPRGAPFALYGRRNAAPSITQHDFSQFVQDETLMARFRRQLNSSSSAAGNRPIYYNTSLVKPVEPGRWFLAVYNDDLQRQEVAIGLTLTNEVATPCPDDCNGRGQCLNGKCLCRDGFAGTDCSTSVCPVLCSGRGAYGGGRCHCEAGWTGAECDQPYSELGAVSSSLAPGSGFVISCSIPCSVHGTCVNGRCQCDAEHTGASCETPLLTCQSDCGQNGRCVNSSCVCSPGWTGSRCHLVSTSCDPRCSQHGQCVNGTCICSRGWNGRHCTLDGCPGNCGNNRGVCLQSGKVGSGINSLLQTNQFSCECAPGWTGSDCSIMTETECGDDKDNDGDGLTDCADSDCCSNPSCTDHLMCLASADPADIAARKPTLSNSGTSSFYQRVKFLVEDNAVQSYAHKDEYVDKRVAVLRGRVLSQQGLGVVGVRVSVDRHPRLGFTLTRHGGWFDILVNGGGAVTLQFQRNPYRPEMRTVWAAWNRIVVLDKVVLRLGDSSDSLTSSNSGERNSKLTSEKPHCRIDEMEMIQPSVLEAQDAEFQHQSGDGQLGLLLADKQVLQEVVPIPGMADYKLVYRSENAINYHSLLRLRLTPASGIPAQLGYVHLRLVVEGTVTQVTLEAEANLTYAFAWDRHNVYGQKIHGRTEAYVHVGYQSSIDGCPTSWQTLVAPMAGFAPNISALGEFNVDVHHHFIAGQNVLFRGDGGQMDLRSGPRQLNLMIGTGSPRSLTCVECQAASPSAYAKILNPVAMASAGDGSLYVGDFNLVRKVTPEGRVFTVLHLPTGQVSYSYYLAVSPIDGSLYLSDCERKQILRVAAVNEEQILNPSSPSSQAGLDNNYEVVVGSGEPCLPADPEMCGDGRPALEARLVFPKGVAVSPDRILYFADGTSVRYVDGSGIIRTLVGRPANPIYGLQPAPCNMAVRPAQIQPLWPTQVALNPIDNTLHWIDNNVVLKLTASQFVQVAAGQPQHCAAQSAAPQTSASHITGFAFGPAGQLYLVEKPGVNSTRLIETDSSGRSEQLKCVSGDGQPCQIPSSISTMAVSPDGAVYVADKQMLQIFSLDYVNPQPDPLSGEYSINWPAAGEVLVFNRYGQHVTTKEPVSGNIKTTFSYTRNGPSGRLMAIIDSRGNKVDFVRESGGDQLIQAIETSASVKSHLTISRLTGALTHINSSNNCFALFDYDTTSKLLIGRTESDGLTTIYRYDQNGRLVQTVLPDGERYTFDTAATSSNIRISLERDNPVELIISGPAIQSGENRMVYNLMKNGTSLVEWAGDNQFSFQPVLQGGTEGWSERLQLSGGSAMRGEWTTSVRVGSSGSRSQDKSIRINGAKFLVAEVDSQTGGRQLYDNDRQLVMGLHCDSQGHLKELRLPPGFHGIRYNYDGNGRLQSWMWGQRQEIYSYDTRGLLAETRSRSDSGNSGSRTIIYGPNDVPTKITLASGRSFSYAYDESGGLKSLTLPSGNGRHSFSVQPSMGYYKLVYLPPGSSTSASSQSAYVEHYDSEGRKLLVMFPGESGRIVYRYRGSRLAEEVCGDRRIDSSAEVDGVTTTTVTEREFELRSDVTANSAGMILEDKTDYGAKTGLAGFKFVYGYDSLLRASSIKGRIGGQILADWPLSYQTKTGSLEQMGQFKISRLRPNETSYFDGTAIFTRTLNPHLELSASSLTLHNEEVFRMELNYDAAGKINQTRTYTRYLGLKSYVNIKNLTYDADGQLVSVDAPESWRFGYDQHGNLAKLTYRGNSIPMQHNAFDRLIKFGEGAYQYDDAGNVIQNAREEKFQWSSSGLLVRAQKKGMFDVRYFYDHHRRLVGRRDQHGNVTQFFYANPQRKYQVSHIFSPRDLRLTTLTYDEFDHLMHFQILRHRYYVATGDRCGTPSVVFSQKGEVVRELVRSPYGHVVYDSNPYLYMPIDWCGGIADPATGHVHVRGDRIYDPLIGQWLNPEWQRATKMTYQPELVHLYRLPGNDPVNLDAFGLTGALRLSHSSRYPQWLNRMGYQLPKIPSPYEYENNALVASKSIVRQPPMLTTSRLLELNQRRKALHEFTDFSSRCSTPNADKLELNSIRFALAPSTLGRGILVSRSSDGRAIVSSTSLADPVIRDVFTNVFNNSRWLNLTLPGHGHGQDTFHFFKRGDNVRIKVAEDMAALRRLGPNVNLTMHDTPDTGAKEIKIATGHGNFVVIYGTDLGAETELLWRHSVKLAARRAWHREQILARRGGINTFLMTQTEMEQLSRDGHLPTYRPELQQSLWSYPMLADDPTAMRFRKRNAAGASLDVPRR